MLSEQIETKKLRTLKVENAAGNLNDETITVGQRSSVNKNQN